MSISDYYQNIALSYRKVDAFTSGGSLGNPAACIFVDSNQVLSDAQMQEIAMQHKGFVSEVVFCKQADSTVDLIYYSSEFEVDFCGHGTIATLYNLFKERSEFSDREKIVFRTRKTGELVAYNRIFDLDAVLITAPQPAYLSSEWDSDRVCKALGIEATKLNNTFPIACIDAGLKTLIVPIASFQAEISLNPDEAKLKQFCFENDVDIVLIFSLDTIQPNAHAHTRVFAPKFGYLEDPATGSGNSAFAYYMLQYDLWDRRDILIEQGGYNQIYNGVRISYCDGSVLFGGSATIRICGKYCI